MGRGRNLFVAGLLALLTILSSLGLGRDAAQGEQRRARMDEGPDNNYENNDDFLTAQGFASGYFLDGTTGVDDAHRIDSYVLHDVPAGKVINASCEITNFDDRPGQGQCLQLTGWNRYHADALARSNSEDNPDRRVWEAVSFLCVVSGDYFIQVKPIAGQGTINYRLNIQAFDPEDITLNIGTGGAFGTTIPGQVSLLKWYPGHWYKFTLNGEQNGMNDYIYVNMTEPGAPDERLLGDIYVRNLEPESWSYWLNHSWWLDSYLQYEEMHAAACHPGTAWYYLDVQAFNTSGGRSENYELRLTKTLIESDGDNHPLNATKVTYEQGKSTIRKSGTVTRGPDMFDWYKVYQKKGGGLSANLTLKENSTAVFRLSIYRDNLTGGGYDLMSSWTNKPADKMLQHVNALTGNVSQEGWYYIGVIAQMGLDPSNVSNPVDWTVQTAWARYVLEITFACGSSHRPAIKYPPVRVVMPEDGAGVSLDLNWTGNNTGVFWDEDFGEEWGDALTFGAADEPNFTININSNDPSAPATIRPNRDWNGEANLTFTATDLFMHSASTVVHVLVVPLEDPPFVKARIPDFVVREGQTNLTMRDIDLFQVFGDPDFPPFGDDNLTFTVDNSTFPSVIVDSKLTFGEAPMFPGKMNHNVMVIITATDKAGIMAMTRVNITVIYINHSPWYNYCENMMEMDENTVHYFDLNVLFTDQDNEPLSFVYLGGASDNLVVQIAPNGTVVLDPAPDYFTDQETLRFKATDPLGANCTGELVVRIREVLHPPRPLPGGFVPDPRKVLFVNETDAFTFRVAAVDFDGLQSELRYTWFVDNVQKTLPGRSSFTWKPTFDDAGPHVVKVRVSYGLACFDSEWNVSVQDVNRPPVITDVWPLNNTELGYNCNVTIKASAYDPDGDPVKFFWRLSDGKLLRTESGRNTSAFSKRLAPGSHIIVLDVEDGRGGLARQYIYVKAPFEPPASPEIQLAWVAFDAAAIVLTAATASFWRRNRR